VTLLETLTMDILSADGLIMQHNGFVVRDSVYHTSTESIAAFHRQGIDGLGGGQEWENNEKKEQNERRKTGRDGGRVMPLIDTTVS